MSCRLLFPLSSQVVEAIDRSYWCPFQSLWRPSQWHRLFMVFNDQPRSEWLSGLQTVKENGKQGCGTPTVCKYVCAPVRDATSVWKCNRVARTCSAGVSDSPMAVAATPWHRTQAGCPAMPCWSLSLAAHGLWVICLILLLLVGCHGLLKNVSAWCMRHLCDSLSLIWSMTIGSLFDRKTRTGTDDHSRPSCTSS